MKTSLLLKTLIGLVIILLVVSVIYYWLQPASGNNITVENIRGRWSLYLDCPNTTFTFLENNKLKISSCDGEYQDTINEMVTYSVQGEKITAILGGDTYEFQVTYDGDESKLKLTKNGQVSVFNKVQ